MGFLMILMLATLAFAQSDTQVSPSKPDKSQDSIKKSDKHDDHSMSDAKSNTSVQSAPASALSSDDRKFIMDAAHGGMLEVQLGRTAVDKATNPDVKQFAQRMVDDHSKANAELAQLASQKGITLPATADAAVIEPGSQSADQATSTSQAMEQQSTTDTSATSQRHARVDADAMLKDEKSMNKLSGLTGDAFDREYISMMVKDHEKDVKEFEKASTKAKDPDVRAFAEKTLPTLREHLQQVRDIQSRMTTKK